MRVGKYYQRSFLGLVFASSISLAGTNGLESRGLMDVAVSAYLAEPVHSKLQRLMVMAEKDDFDAQVKLGHIYLTGEGVNKNVDVAAKWFRRAAEAGVAEAQFQIGLMYVNGEGVPEDSEKALDWAIRAMQNGSKDAQFLYQYLMNEAYYIGC